MIEGLQKNKEKVVNNLGKIGYLKIFLIKYYETNNQEGFEDVLKIILSTAEKIELLLEITETTNVKKDEKQTSVLDLLDNIQELKQLKKSLEKSKNKNLPEDISNDILKSLSVLREIINQQISQDKN